MKKKVLIISSIIIFVLILGISLFFILDKDEEPIKLKDFSFVNVDEIKTKEISTLDDNIVSVRDIRISDGYLEGIVFINGDKSFNKLKVLVSLYDIDGNLLDEISFEFENMAPYEERDLFYAIQKDLSNAYYVDIKEG
ncbi:MAG: hypothetical protein E7162_04795 [Firmicutes bacterium]|nr:hypothetical protein [Bacillota bacterium]